MMGSTRGWLFGTALTCIAFATTPATAARVDATYTVTGSAGAWTYDFTFTNNIAPDQYLYFIGVEAPDAVIVGTPYNFYTYPGYNPGNSGGPDKFYNINWLQQGNYSSTIGYGQSQSGFKILGTGQNVITNFNYFGYGYGNGARYFEGDNFSTTDNPGFAGVTSVPEPAAWALMIGGFGLIGAASRRRRLNVSFG